MVLWRIAGILAAAMLMLGGSAPQQSMLSRPPGTSRIDLQRHDLSIAGREAIQLRVDFDGGKDFPRHSHPGEEFVYVLKGTLEYRLDGQAPVTLGPGGVLFIPAGANHAAKNVGSDAASELATYVVQKGKPLVELAK